MRRGLSCLLMDAQCLQRFLARSRSLIHICGKNRLSSEWMIASSLQ